MEVDDELKTNDKGKTKECDSKETALCNGNGSKVHADNSSEEMKEIRNSPEGAEEAQKERSSPDTEDKVKGDEGVKKEDENVEREVVENGDDDGNKTEDTLERKNEKTDKSYEDKTEAKHPEGSDDAQSTNKKEKKVKNTTPDSKSDLESKTEEPRSETPTTATRSETPASHSRTSTPVNAKSTSQTSTPVNVQPSSRTSTPVNVKAASRTATPVGATPSSRTATPASGTSTPVNATPGSSTPGTSKEASAESSSTAAKKAATKKSKVTRMLDQTGPAENFRPIAQLLFDIGMDVTRQTVYKDLIRIQKKKEGMGKLDEKEKVQLDKLGNAYTDLIFKNETFINEFSSCNHCGFKTDSNNIMTCHMEFAHDQHLNVFTCVLCSTVLNSAAQFLYHMESQHNRRGRIFMKHAFFVCPNCPYESNNNSQFKKHTDKCTKVFNPRQNLMPLAPDKDIPLMALRPPAPKAPPKPKVVPKPSPRPFVPTVHPHPRLMRPQGGQQVPRPVINMGPSARANFTPTIMGPRGPGGMPVRPGAIPQSRPIRNQVPAPKPTPVAPPRPAAPAAPQIAADGAPLVQMNGQFYKLAMVGTQQFLVPVSDPSAIQAASAAQTSPKIIGSKYKGKAQVTSSATAKGSITNNSVNKDFEVCEICGGFVKDREALRIHFIWAHKVHIHKDVFKTKKPPIVCTQCKGAEIRFWTTQGLQKHRADGHKAPGLSRPALSKRVIDQIVKKCIYCLELFPNTITSKQFWDHMAIHGINPASIFRTNKCCACGVRIVDAKLMNQHLRAKHDLLFSKGAPPAVQPTQQIASTSVATAKPKKKCPFCAFATHDVIILNKHTLAVHPFRCSRCPQRFDEIDAMHQHFSSKHSQEKDKCPLCKEKVKIGRAYIRHMKSEHMKGCTVVVQRIARSILDTRRHELNKILAASALAKQKQTPSKRKRESPQKKDAVIILDEDSPPRKKNRSNSPRATTNGKEVLEVDGEEIVVELQEDDDEEEQELTIKISSSESLSEASEKTGKKMPNGDVGTSEDGGEMNLKITSATSLADKQPLRKKRAGPRCKTMDPDVSVEYISSDTGNEQKANNKNQKSADRPNQSEDAMEIS